MRKAQKAGSPAAAARPASTAINRRRVKDTWRDRANRVGERKPLSYMVGLSHNTRVEMDIYNAWFDLKAGVSDVEFSYQLKTYMYRLKSDGLMQGWRLTRRKLGLSAAPVGEFHLMME